MSLPGDARLPWPSHVASTTAVLDPLPSYVRGDPQRGWVQLVRAAAQRLRLKPLRGALADGTA